jgi:c-di-GMP-binding flagellar brake protein YcgR
VTEESDEKKKHVIGHMPPNLRVIERRKYPRAPVDLGVQVGFPSVSEFLSAHAKDLSRGGLFLAVESLASFQPEQRMILRVSLGGERSIEASARVVRVVDSKAPGAISGIAVEFVDLDQFSAQLIDHTVDEQLKTLGIDGMG